MKQWPELPWCFIFLGFYFDVCTFCLFAIHLTSELTTLTYCTMFSVWETTPGQTISDAGELFYHKVSLRSQPHL